MSLQLVFASLFGAFVLGVLAGTAARNRSLEAEAVIKGHAEWVSYANGNPKFKWKEAKP